MVYLQSLLLVCATLGQTQPAEPVLLSFSSPHCGPCQTMVPVVAQLQQAGYRVQKIDVTQRRDLAGQYRIEAVPCFIMVADGREVERVLGPTSLQHLQGMFHKVARPAEQAVVRGQSPDHFGHNHAGHDHSGHAHAVAGAQRQAAPLTGGTNEVAPDALRTAERKALAATVRLKVDDPDGNSYGTGTIIDQHGNHALILTCGHIFRDSNGKGQITIDIFNGGSPISVPGHLIDFDLTRDVALVAMRPDVTVQAVPVAGQSFRAVRGSSAFSVGCDRGAEPTVRRSRVTNIDRYQGKPNIEAAGAPVVGRSGGGLFTADGILIGVCNFADEEANEGIYAAPGAFQAHLDQAGLEEVYQRSGRRPAEQLAAVAPPADDPRPSARSRRDPVVAPTRFDYASSPRKDLVPISPASNSGMPPITPASNLAAGQTINLPAHAATAEVVCIVRTRNGEQRTVVLPRASQALIEQLSREEAAQRSTIARQPDQGDPVIRAQSGEW